MPNWCENSIVIRPKDTEEGYKEMFQFMKRFIKEQPNIAIDTAFFDIFYPIPEEEKANWFEWCCEYWGTKWDLTIFDAWNEAAVRDLTLRELFGEDKWTEPLEIYANSAWCPPLEGFKHISRDYPNLIFNIDYREDGMAFCGEAFIENGNVEDFEKEYTYDEDE